MWGYKFEHRTHYVCQVCHETDVRHVYNDETQVAIQDQLSLLQKKCDDLKERGCSVCDFSCFCVYCDFEF